MREPPTTRASTTSPSRRSPVAGASVSIAARSRGVRRRREESATATIEIEELDSDVMRQNSYNYFQRHTTRGGNGRSGHGSSRKRQRTLAEQLEELCLQSHRRNGNLQIGRSTGSNSRSLRRGSGLSAASSPSSSDSPSSAFFVAAANGDDVDMDGSVPSPSGTEADADDDDDLEDADADGPRNSHSQRFEVLGGVADGVKDMFFSTPGGRQRPMDRMFRHYVTMAAARSDPTTLRGDAIVPFRTGPTSLEFPYSLFTPEQIQDLRARHNRKKKSRLTRGTGPGDHLNVEGQGTASGDQSWRFEELDSSDEADVSSAAEDSDMDLSGDGDESAPHHAGKLSHGEWFLEDEDI